MYIAWPIGRVLGRSHDDRLDSKRPFEICNVFSRSLPKSRDDLRKVSGTDGVPRVINELDVFAGQYAK
jgi:hypothetical protein